MTPRFSRLMLTTHISFSVGWFGIVAGFLALSIVGLIGNAPIASACYLSMNVIAWFVILPFCICSLLTGLIQSLGTHWGLFKHYWIVVKLILTLVATIVLLLHMQPIRHIATVASETSLSITDLRSLRIQLIADAGAALLVLLATTTVSVYKPWGKTEFALALPKFQPTTKRPFGFYLLIGFIVVATLFILLHIFQGGMKH